MFQICGGHAPHGYGFEYIIECAVKANCFRPDMCKKKWTKNNIYFLHISMEHVEIIRHCIVFDRYRLSNHQLAAYHSLKDAVFEVQIVICNKSTDDTERNMYLQNNDVKLGNF